MMMVMMMMMMMIIAVSSSYIVCPSACVHCALCSVTQLLDNIQQIAEHNNFFDPGFRASEMDDIPELYHRIIDDPALLHDRVVGLKSKLHVLQLVVVIHD